jgi:hypothetical protein
LVENGSGRCVTGVLSDNSGSGSFARSDCLLPRVIRLRHFLGRFLGASGRDRCDLLSNLRSGIARPRGKDQERPADGEEERGDDDR